MRKTLSLTALFLLSLTVFAQKDKEIPGFGKVDKAELELKECDFDKNAEAVVLFDVAELSSIPNSVNTIFNRHVRIKILKDKGLSHADIRLPYYAFKNFEMIKHLSAQTYNLDEAGNIVVTKLEKKLIYDKKIDKRFSENVFTFPQVKAGSVLEYKYEMHSSISSVELDGWYFQEDIPVKLSRYTISFPSDIIVHAIPNCSLPVEVKTLQKANNDIKIYTMRNIPALRDEPYISCTQDYLQRIEPRIIAFNGPYGRESLLSTWPKVIKGLMEDEDFGLQLKKEIPRTADLDAELKTISDPYRRMVAIHNYVRKNMEWNGGKSIWAMEGVKAAWKEKKGTCGEINLILVNLLKDAGLKAHPILLSSRENGRIMIDIASASQFDKVLAYVTIGEKVYVLDGTDKFTPSKIIPADVIYSEGLVIEKLDTYEWGWKTLWDPAQVYKNLVVLRGIIGSDGKMSGESSVYSYDYARLNRIPAIKQDKKKYLEETFASRNPSFIIDSFTVENEDVDTLPLVHKFKFQHPLSGSGDYKYFSVNLFTGLEQNPFIADTRFSDVFFGTNQQFNITANITIPEDHSFEELPKSIRMIMPFYELQFVHSAA